MTDKTSTTVYTNHCLRMLSYSNGLSV